MPKRKTNRTTGIACDCGSFDTRTVKVEQHNGFTVRRVKCLKCGASFPTRECRADKASPSTASIYVQPIAKIAEIMREANELLEGIAPRRQHDA